MRTRTRTRTRTRNSKLASIRKVMMYPLTKKCTCRRCGGRGYINPRGMISSDTCPECSGKGKSHRTDYGESAKRILAICEDSTEQSNQK